ncbi:MAG: divalent metal cation transporter [Opitutales bacterium]|nr:divalent metal cation transporter [Opitutales bacterium]MDG2168849.1 divalent metal cation transporter [Opitutales bacterium]
MSDPIIEKQREMLVSAAKEGKGASVKTYMKLSGPGWLQSAITLGGGSLAGSLYLGIIGGYELMWLQPLMMIFGIVMLSAIAYVSLSTGERPLAALNNHVNPVLGYGWAVATLMANMVWAMPQFSLGTAAMRQNLGLFSGNGGEYICAIILFVIGVFVVWLYDASAKGYKIFDYALKIMVGIVVLSFFMVVVALTFSDTGLPWGKIFAGFIPDPELLFEPASSLSPLVAASSAPEYWSDLIVSQQRDRMVAAAATAVGINMTFLLPYSLLKRGWDKDFRGLARFDLATALFIPFLLATSCVVIAAASQFHANPEPGLIEVHSGAAVEVSAKLQAAYEGNLGKMLSATGGGDATTAIMGALPEADRVLAATLIQRDAFALANSLENLAGPGIAQIVFGIGVVGMAISTIIILMLINGFVICELAGKPTKGKLYFIGCLLAGIAGALGALFLWSGKAQFYLAVPTSRFGMVLLPIAYIAFFFLMNNKKLLGDAMPQGTSRIWWNILMGIAVLLALTGATISILNDKAMIPGTGISIKSIAFVLLAVLAIWAVIIHFKRKGAKSG